jgi:uncharacterized protein YdcH (DUF465 family)
MMMKPAVLDVSHDDFDVDKLQQAHADIDRRVRELDRRAILTPAEQAERSELKKRKLALKDLIRASQPPPEPIGQA